MEFDLADRIVQNNNELDIECIYLYHKYLQCTRKFMFLVIIIYFILFYVHNIVGDN